MTLNHFIQKLWITIGLKPCSERRSFAATHHFQINVIVFLIGGMVVVGAIEAQLYAIELLLPKLETDLELKSVFEEFMIIEAFKDSYEELVGFRSSTHPTLASVLISEK